MMTKTITFRYIHIILYFIISLSACSEKTVRQKDIRTRTALENACFERFKNVDMIEYSIQAVEGRLAIYLANKYLVNDLEIPCQNLLPDTKVGKRIFDMFNFITPETYSFYSCQEGYRLEVIVLPNYVNGEFAEPHDMHGLCIFNEYPFDREKYKVKFIISGDSNEVFQSMNVF